MAVEPSDKQKLVESLLEIRRQGQLAELSLRFQHKTAEADQIAAANAGLGMEIDTLIGSLMEEWIEASTDVMARLEEANKDLEARVADIKARVDLARNVIRVAGMIDDAAELARKFLGV